MSASLSLPRFFLLSTLAGLSFIGTGLRTYGQVDSASKALLLDAAREGDSLFAVGERGAILRSSSEGSAWSRIPSPCAAPLTGLSFAPSSAKGWAVGHEACLLSTIDSGKSWQIVRHGEAPDSIFMDVLALDESHVIVIGAYGMALSSEDSGKTWTRIHPVADDRHLNRISAGQDGSLYISGERGLLLRSKDKGSTWETLETPYDGSFFGVLSLSDGSLIAYGLRGHVFRSESADRIVWKAAVNSSAGLIATLIELKDGRLLAAGQARGVLLSSDRGRSFTPVQTNVNTAVAELFQTSDGSILSFGEAGVVQVNLP